MRLNTGVKLLAGPSRSHTASDRACLPVRVACCHQSGWCFGVQPQIRDAGTATN